MTGGEHTTPEVPGTDRAGTELDQFLQGTVGEPLTVANEFTEVVVRRIDTRNGSRLLIQSPRSGQWITLDALEVEALTWQNTRTLTAMVGAVHTPLLPDEEPAPTEAEPQS